MDAFKAATGKRSFQASFQYMHPNLVGVLVSAGIILLLFSRELFSYAIEKFISREVLPKCSGEWCGDLGWTVARKDSESCHALCVKCGWISCQCRLGYASGWLARRSFWRKTPAWQQYRDQLTCDEMFARPSRMRLIYDLHDIQRSGWRIPVEASRQKPDSNCHLGRGINKKDCSDSIDLVQESSSAPVIDTTPSISETYVSR